MYYDLIDRSRLALRHELHCSRLTLSREAFAVLACLALAVIFTNVSFFRIGGVNYLCYFMILAMGCAYFLTDTRRPMLLYFLFPFMMLADLDFALGYFILFAFNTMRSSDNSIDRDLDIKVFGLLTGILMLYNIATDKVVYYAALGFVGRLEFGFAHPNIPPVWALLVSYLCKHYWGGRYFYPSVALSLSLVIATGSLGVIPVFLIIMFSDWMFRMRKLAFYAVVGFVLAISAAYLLSGSDFVTKIASGRNVVYAGLLGAMDFVHLFVTVPQESLINIGSIRAFFQDDYTETIPFDNVISAATASGPVFAILFAIAAGLFRCPDNRKDFDRLLMFWCFGLTLNPISIWSPFFLLAIRRSVAKPAPR